MRSSIFPAVRLAAKLRVMHLRRWVVDFDIIPLPSRWPVTGLSMPPPFFSEQGLILAKLLPRSTQTNFFTRSWFEYTFFEIIKQRRRWRGGGFFWICLHFSRIRGGFRTEPSAASRNSALHIIYVDKSLLWRTNLSPEGSHILCVKEHLVFHNFRYIFIDSFHLFRFLAGSVLLFCCLGLEGSSTSFVFFSFFLLGSLAPLRSHETEAVRRNRGSIRLLRIGSARWLCCFVWLLANVYWRFSKLCTWFSVKTVRGM